MANKPIYIIYLRPDVAHKEWSFLHRFFHPGILDHDKKYAFVAFSLDISHYTFLSATLRDFSTNKNKKIHIPYTLVAAMVEVRSDKNRKTPLGFLNWHE